MPLILVAGELVENSLKAPKASVLNRYTNPLIDKLGALPASPIKVESHLIESGAETQSRNLICRSQTPP